MAKFNISQLEKRLLKKEIEKNAQKTIIFKIIKQGDEINEQCEKNEILVVLEL